MKTPWFRPWGVWHRPVHPAGWLVTGMCIAFCVHIFRFFDRHSHSATDTLYHIFPYVVPTFLFWECIARRTSGGAARDLSSGQS